MWKISRWYLQRYAELALMGISKVFLSKRTQNLHLSAVLSLSYTLHIKLLLLTCPFCSNVKAWKITLRIRNYRKCFPWKSDSRFEKFVFSSGLLSINEYLVYRFFFDGSRKTSRRRPFTGSAGPSSSPQWSNYAIKAANSEELKKNARVTNRIPACGRVSSRRVDLASPS